MTRICRFFREPENIHGSLGHMLCIACTCGLAYMLLFFEYVHSRYSNKISDAKQLTLSLDFTFLHASDKYDLSSKKKTFGKDDVGTYKHTLHARRKSFCKLDASCWAFSFGALL